MADDENKIVDKSTSDAFFKSLKNNKQCADCPRHSPVWVSTSFGIFLCSDCAAKHRALGVNISKIKSVLLDKWTVGELRRVYVSGNKTHELGDTEDIRLKYSGADLYKEKIDKMVEKSLREQPGLRFIKKQTDRKLAVVVNEVKKAPVPKFRDSEVVVEEATKPKPQAVKSNAFVVKKKKTPSVTKNGASLYNVGNISNTRLGFGSSPNKEQ